MDMSLVIMGGLVVALGIGAYLTQGWPLILSGLNASTGMLRTVWFRMLLGILMAGMIQVLIPAETIGRWMGPGSGLRGILVGTIAGALTPGGPFVNFPIVAALQQGGAGVGPLAAYLTAWGVIPLNRTLVWELPFLGQGFTVSRLLASAPVPILVGLLTTPVANALARLVKMKLPG